ncbi:hypothetical protein CEXT_342581 [Caerostris extrusa]|uniref:Mos1 transposase HTH domain-containing protein n=1 Tax=Caerostris extrusa TaxID=172846 RepID=A0AAV4TU81_CAEEX|nr:hypothetical protein CEXT_342581 [Caerostris extrusa]
MQLKHIVCYGEHAPSKSICEDWFKCFRSGDFDTEEKICSGRRIEKTMVSSSSYGRGLQRWAVKAFQKDLRDNCPLLPSVTLPSERAFGDN